MADRPPIKETDGDMKKVAIIQARMGSSRLPGKVLLSLGNKPMLKQVVERVRLAKTLDDVIVATTISKPDQQLVDFCAAQKIPCVKGSELDVLDRYYEAALNTKPGVIVRITSDCPFIDPDVIDLAVEELLASGSDYVSNAFVRTYPRGLDCEAFTFHALERAWKEAKKEYERVHVTPFFYQNPDLFRIKAVCDAEDNQNLRLTVDTPEDFEFAQKLQVLLPESFRLKDILRILRQHPDLLEINKSIVQKSLHEG